MTPRKPRNLRPDELALWQKSVEKTARLAAKRTAALQPGRPAKTEPIAAKSPPIMSFRIGAKPMTQPVRRPAAQPVLAMDHRAFKKMKGGKLVPEARLDLHGLTLSQAHPRLIRFLEDNAFQGRRLVLVITGKGRAGQDDGPIPARPGALRHQVPHWLHSMPLKPLVLQISEANRKHGGQGALYVYLRRQRG